MGFEGKCVVVTGASSGIGRRIVLDFAKQGATVIAVARRKERLDELADEAKNFGGSVVAFVGDVADQKTNEDMIDLAVEKCGKIDVLVNNAGIMDEFIPIGDLDNDTWERVMKVNLDGPMYAMRKAVQQMLKQESGGNIVNVASIGGVNGCRAGAAYTASKHALVGITKNTAFMYAGKLRCNVICPGGVETEVMATQTNINQTGLGRVMAGLDASIPQGQTEHISSAVLYTASDAAAFMTGAVIVIDGGVSCN